MASRLGSDDDADNNKGSMWILEQKLDRPIDEEAARLKNMYRQKSKICKLIFMFFLFLIY
ncbi:hypothetical protein AHAS_Ahas10G0135600 [Arachis hypogaea]